MAEEKKFANPLVYGLLALLMLTLAGLAWMWVRMRKNSQAGYAWLDSEPTMSSYAEPLADTEIAKPTFAKLTKRHLSSLCISVFQRLLSTRLFRRLKKHLKCRLRKHKQCWTRRPRLKHSISLWFLPNPKPTLTSTSTTTRCGLQMLPQPRIQTFQQRW